jgi:hypothetical protein
MATTRGRVVYNNELVRDQADFFQPDGYTRVTGLTILQIQDALFFNNVPQPWVLTSGSGVTDSQIASGKVYWNEIPGAPGYYNVRFMPNAVGYWRLLIIYPSGTQIAAQDYDVTELPSSGPPGGLSSSFNKPGCQ